MCLRVSGEDFLCAINVLASDQSDLKPVDPFSPLGGSPDASPAAHGAGPPPPSSRLSLPSPPTRAHTPDRPAGGVTARMWVSGDALSDAGPAGGPRLPPPVNRACGRAAARGPPRAGTCPPWPPTGPGDAPTRPCPSDVLMAMNWGAGGVSCLLAPVSRADGQGKVGEAPSHAVSPADRQV